MENEIVQKGEEVQLMIFWEHEPRTAGDEAKLRSGARTGDVCPCHKDEQHKKKLMGQRR
jgi:hypothetical protein